jgi:Uma2 family endonuclease
MTEQVIDSETRIDRENGVYGRVVARDVSAEDYMAQHAAYFREWVEGVVIDVSPVSDIHNLLTGYLWELLRAYFHFNPIGSLFSEPFVMQLDVTHSRREPDLQVILDTNANQRSSMAMIGAADICIEVVSRESISRDYGDKFEEYQAAGVKEYWIIDPLRKVASFHRLDENGIYIPQAIDTNSDYQTPLLPQLRIHVPTFWLTPVPSLGTTYLAVEAMMKKPSE